MSKSLDPANPDSALFFEALDFASELHAGQRRRSGAPYISHPCSVAEILVREMHSTDPLLLAAALLHDVVEDVPWVSLDDIDARFGYPVAELVDGVHKTDQISPGPGCAQGPHSQQDIYQCEPKARGAHHKTGRPAP